MATLLLAGCYPNKAAIDPWSYAPLSPSNPWSPPPAVKPMPLSTEEPQMQEQIDPYSLAEIIDIALKNNQQTKVTWAQARSAAANYAQTQNPFFPSVSADFSYTRARQPAFSTNAPGSSTGPIGSSGAPTSVSVSDIYYSLWGPQLTLSYLIYDFGTSRATSEAAKQALYSADWTHNSAILSVLQTVMSDFYGYLYQQQLLVADEANIQTAELTLNAALTGFDSGVRDVSDVLQSKTQLLQQQTSWAAQKQNVENAYTTLLTDMGLPANRSLTMQPLLTMLPPKDILPPTETLIAVALQNRPDLLSMEATVRSNQQTLIATQRQFLPQFNYNFDIGKNYYNQGLHDKYNFTSTVSVSMPLFKGFYYRNAIKIAEANTQQAQEQLRLTQLDVVQQVTAYHYSVRTSFETVEFAQGFLAAAQEQYTVALAQYKQGTNTILDVVSAQSSLADARAQLAQAFDSWYTSLANLAYATGLLSPTRLMPFEQAEEIKIAVRKEPIQIASVEQVLNIFKRLTR
jgi:outer membrane protein TolC